MRVGPRRKGRRYVPQRGAFDFTPGNGTVETIRGVENFDSLPEIQVVGGEKVTDHWAVLAAAISCRVISFISDVHLLRWGWNVLPT